MPRYLVIPGGVSDHDHLRRRHGPWTSNAPARLAKCYRSAHDWRPIAEAVANRFGDEFHATAHVAEMMRGAR